MSERNITYLTNACLITCIVEMGSAEKVLEAAKKLSIPVCELKIKNNSLTGEFDLFEDERDYNSPNENDEALFYTHLELLQDQKLYL